MQLCPGEQRANSSTCWLQLLSTPSQISVVGVHVVFTVTVAVVDVARSPLETLFKLTELPQAVNVTTPLVVGAVQLAVKVTSLPTFAFGTR